MWQLKNVSAEKLLEDMTAENLLESKLRTAMICNCQRNVIEWKVNDCKEDRFCYFYRIGVAQRIPGSLWAKKKKKKSVILGFHINTVVYPGD